jgi:ubiquinone/menaquinone biosynthesis C-methylase UbiE
MLTTPADRGKLSSKTIETQVAQHYGRTDLEGAILDALVATGCDPDRLTPSDLSPVDEFHTGGREATIALADAAGFATGARLLDVGCGIGGPSRFFAAERGCHVIGIDLTEDYVRTAVVLSRRVGLGDRVEYRQASALDLPCEREAFDGAYMMHVGMNIADKPALCAEVRRVLKPGGSFAIYDLMRVGPGDLRFPLHWSEKAETSFVAPPAAYREALGAAGFEIVSERERGDFARQVFRQAAANLAASGGPPPLGIHILMKSGFAEKLANVLNAVEAGVIAPVELVCRAR